MEFTIIQKFQVRLGFVQVVKVYPIYRVTIRNPTILVTKFVVKGLNHADKSELLSKQSATGLIASPCDGLMQSKSRPNKLMVLFNPVRLLLKSRPPNSR